MTVATPESEFDPKKEEITDMIDDRAYTDRDADGRYVFRKGRVLRFEGAALKVTKIDRKNKRIWAQHIELINQAIVGSHQGHDVDIAPQTPFCRDCQVPVNEPSTEDGEVKAKDRDDRTLPDGTSIE